MEEASDIRETFYSELKEKITNEKIQIVKFSEPSNGKTIKINGIVLYKISQSNPYKKKGVVIWKHITDSALSRLNGMRSQDKKNWVACPLTSGNYDLLMEILFDICCKINIKTQGGKLKKKVRNARRTKSTETGNITSMETVETKINISPKKKITRR